MKKIGFLTSGGDCQSLNATMRGVAKTLYQTYPDVEIYGILEGYKGLIYGNYRKMQPSDFRAFLRKAELLSEHRDSRLKRCVSLMRTDLTRSRL